MTDDDRAGWGYPDHVETETVAGVAVPTACRDRIDDEALAAAVDALDEHTVSQYRVSPVGGLKVRVGVYRPMEQHESIRAALEDATHGVRDHGTRDGFRRLRAALVAPEE